MGIDRYLRVCVAGETTASSMDHAHGLAGGNKLVRGSVDHWCKSKQGNRRVV